MSYEELRYKAGTQGLTQLAVVRAIHSLVQGEGFPPSLAQVPCEKLYFMGYRLKEEGQMDPKLLRHLFTAVNKQYAKPNQLQEI